MEREKANKITGWFGGVGFFFSFDFVWLCGGFFCGFVWGFFFLIASGVSLQFALGVSLKRDVMPHL